MWPHILLTHPCNIHKEDKTTEMTLLTPHTPAFVCTHISGVYPSAFTLSINDSFYNNKFLSSVK